MSDRSSLCLQSPPNSSVSVSRSLDILLVADSNEIKANPSGKVVGTIIEAELDKSKGVIATLLVQNGDA
ncbi:MAG: hypothetical protein HC838_06955 [Spirulinaceae cyanobacterium RM2_2_10]|nr:hypothetical protein [Spirulinaceae cyanobacterium RM2_2_10]